MRGLSRKERTISHLRELRDNHDATGFSRELWTEFAKMGWAEYSSA